ncbi:MAG: hypothetical protein OXG24_08685 [Gammaproteobacteria bacterium]|nr:hypothetical protein [Gammaproteobacteria bacterium]
MNRLMHRLQHLTAAGALMVSAGILAGIEGTYLLEANRNKSTVRQPTLTINIDDEGSHSATLTSQFGAVSNTDDVTVSENELKATFVLEAGQGEFKVSYAGKVENGLLSGTISSDFGASVELVGRLQGSTETAETDLISIEEAIEDCYTEVTDKPMDNINRITYETDQKLEECVNERVSSPKRIKLQYSGSKRGLVPEVREETD